MWRVFVEVVEIQGGGGSVWIFQITIKKIVFSSIVNFSNFNIPDHNMSFLI